MNVYKDLDAMVHLTELITLNQHLKADGLLTLNVRHLVIWGTKTCSQNRSSTLLLPDDKLGNADACSIFSKSLLCPMSIWRNTLPHHTISQFIFQGEL